jgi:hypothetical protein
VHDELWCQWKCIKASTACSQQCSERCSGCCLHKQAQTQAHTGRLGCTAVSRTLAAVKPAGRQTPALGLQPQQLCAVSTLSVAVTHSLTLSAAAANRGRTQQTAARTQPASLLLVHESSALSLSTQPKPMGQTQARSNNKGDSSTCTSAARAQLPANQESQQGSSMAALCST